METDNMDLLIEFAKTGIGIGCVIKEFVKKELDDRILMEYTRDIPRIDKREVCFAYSSGKISNPHLIDFMDYVNSEKNNRDLNILI